MKSTVIISTHNRRDLTGIALDWVMACKSLTTPVHVLDDASTEYDVAWLNEFGVVVRRSMVRKGVGIAARTRIEHFVESDADLAIMLDNDALVVPGFDRYAKASYCELRRRHIEPVVFTLYRSTYHETLTPIPTFDATASNGMNAAYDATTFDEMKDIGGISLVMDRATALHLLDSIETWDSQWDFQLQKHARVFAPRVSYVEHIGRHGSGVNGQSGDRAVNFVGYMGRGV